MSKKTRQQIAEEKLKKGQRSFTKIETLILKNQLPKKNTFAGKLFVCVKNYACGLYYEACSDMNALFNLNRSASSLDEKTSDELKKLLQSTAQKASQHQLVLF